LANASSLTPQLLPSLDNGSGLERVIRAEQKKLILRRQELKEAHEMLANVEHQRFAVFQKSGNDLDMKLLERLDQAENQYKKMVTNRERDYQYQQSRVEESLDRHRQSKEKSNAQVMRKAKEFAVQWKNRIETFKASCLQLAKKREHLEQQHRMVIQRCREEIDAELFHGLEQYDDREEQIGLDLLMCLFGRLEILHEHAGEITQRIETDDVLLERNRVELEERLSLVHLPLASWFTSWYEKQQDWQVANANVFRLEQHARILARLCWYRSWISE
jgi:hypothetical protein